MMFFTAVVGCIALMAGAGRSDAQEVSFQWFKTNLLATGQVEKLEVANKALVKVFVRPSQARCGAISNVQAHRWMHIH